MARKSLDASGDLSSEGGGLTANARLEDLGLLTSAVRGPASITARTSPAQPRVGRSTRTLRGPGGLDARADGLVGLEDGHVDVDVQTEGACHWRWPTGSFPRNPSTGG
jgi:hypothetical protein